MKTHFIIDGYDLIFRGAQVGDPVVQERTGRARRQLVDLVCKFTVSRGYTATVIFDGMGKDPDVLPPLSDAMGVKVIFAKPGEKVYPLLDRAIGASMDPDKSTVVTSHPRILELADKVGMGVSRPREFFERMRGELKKRGEFESDEPTDKRFTVGANDVAFWENMVKKGKRGPREEIR